MPFIPHTEQDIVDMLKVVGVSDTEQLFDEIPAELRSRPLQHIPPAMNEQELTRLMMQRAEQDGRPLCFVGAGAYEHHIPAAVWQLVTRGEFYSAYTPYQAEASQGTLQLIYEFQSMMTALMGMDVSNASLYDGASALAEAVLMAIRANRKSRSRRVLVPSSVHPAYRATARAIVGNQEIELVELPFDERGGHVSLDSLAAYEGEDIAALVIAQPNFFGVLEDVDVLTDWAQRNGAMVIAVVNPLAMALLKPPGRWGQQGGADIAVGEGQPLGVPLSSGGPYFGFMCSRQQHVRQMPGRLVGRTVDRDGRDGYTLTLQAREQHIRRSKATSNICTNQGLLVSAATVHMALLGGEGLRRVALACHARTRQLSEKISSEYLKPRFNRPYFHERVMTSTLPLQRLLRPLYAHNLQPGYLLGDDYPELGEALLVCATETKNDQDLELYSDYLARAIDKQVSSGCPVQPKMA
jgi:glycine dehydrogenase subunit 1